MIIVPRFWRMIIVVIIDAFDLLPESEPGKKTKDAVGLFWFREIEDPKLFVV